MNRKCSTNANKPPHTHGSTVEDDGNYEGRMVFIAASDKKRKLTRLTTLRVWYVH